MDGWKHWFTLLLPLCVCVDNRVTVVKTISTEMDITPVCNSADVGAFLLVRCKINTVTHRRDECVLLYTGNEQFDHDCDSRFMLLYQNFTVFIHLVDLTPMDSGNYECQCSYERGTRDILFDITVKGEQEETLSGVKLIAAFVVMFTVCATFVIIAGMMCDHVRGDNHRVNSTSGAFELNRCETPWPVGEDDLYTNLQQTTTDVYYAISSNSHHSYSESESTSDVTMACCDYEQVDGKEKDIEPVYTIYETM